MPWEILRHFSFIPHLKWMLRTPNQIQLMHWFIIIKVLMAKCNMLQIPIKQWNFIDNRWIDFVKYTYNVKRGLTTNEINPFSRKNQHVPFGLSFFSITTYHHYWHLAKKILHHVTIDYLKWRVCDNKTHRHILKTSFWGIVNPLKWRNLHIGCNDLQWIIN